MTATADTVAACPSCGSMAIHADWDTVTTARIENGHVTYVLTGGFLGALPDRLFCGDCATTIEPDETNAAFFAAAHDTVATVAPQLMDSTDLHTDVPEARAAR